MPARSELFLHHVAAMKPTSIRELLLGLGLCAGIGTSLPSCGVGVCNGGCVTDGVCGPCGTTATGGTAGTGAGGTGGSGGASGIGGAGGIDAANGGASGTGRAGSQSDGAADGPTHAKDGSQ